VYENEPSFIVRDHVCMFKTLEHECDKVHRGELSKVKLGALLIFYDISL